MVRALSVGHVTGKKIAELLSHQPPKAKTEKGTGFRPWGKKNKWKEAAKAHGQSTAVGEQLSSAGEAHYRACDAAYGEFRTLLGQMAFQRFVDEFTALKVVCPIQARRRADGFRRSASPRPRPVGDI